MAMMKYKFEMPQQIMTNTGGAILLRGKIC